MLIQILILVCAGAIADLARGEERKLPSALGLSTVMALVIYLNSQSIALAGFAVAITFSGFYLAAMTSPRPLFGAIHGSINPEEWKYNPANKWLYTLSLKLADPINDGKWFGIIYGFFRGLYCLPATFLFAWLFFNSFLAPIGILGCLQGICYWVAGKALPGKESNARLARVLFGSIQGLILGLVATLY